MKHRRRTLLIASLIVLAFTAVFISRQRLQTVRLSDGRVIKLEDHAFSSHMVFYELPHRPFARKIKRVLPHRVTWNMNWLNPEVTVSVYPRLVNEPILSVAFSMHDASGKLLPYQVGTRVAVCIDDGHVFDSLINELGNRGVFELPAFPRRGRKLALRLMEDDKVLGEFQIPNPAAGQYGQWKEARPPVTVTNEGLEITLVRFTVNQSRHRTECAFLVREAGKPTTAWRPNTFEIADATGNHWRAPTDIKLGGVNEGHVQGGFFGALWQEEKAWKLRVGFKSTDTNSASTVEFLASPEQTGGRP